MGMAASQARLLCITARIHDVEYQAQSIQNAKTQLATLSDRAYNDYLSELDATVLTVSAIDKSSETSKVVANFNTLCSRKKVQPSDRSEYAIRDKNGKLLVEDEVFEKYNEFKGLNCSQDAYTFAMYVVSGDNGSAMGDNSTKDESEDGERGGNIDRGLRLGEELAYKEATKDTGKNDRLYSLRQSILSVIDRAATETGEEAIADDIYDTKGLVSKCKDNQIKDDYRKALNSYKEELYKRKASTILEGSDPAGINASTSYENTSAKDFNIEDFNYYLNIYKQIQVCGGCRPISDYDGSEHGDAANNAEWLQAMIQCGELTVEIVDKQEDGSINMNATSPSSDISLSYTPATEIDKKALVKAEAKYEKALKDIDKKDKQFDLSLSRLETERSALTTQYESLQKVIDENIERTFGIFS